MREQYRSVVDKYPQGYLKWTNVTENEWDSKNIDEKDPEDVRSFYSETPNYIFELMEYHSTEDKQRLTETVVKYCLGEDVDDVLDYGAGIWQDSIVAALNGLNASAADIPGKTSEFGKWRAERYGVDISFVPIRTDFPLEQDYDAITCFEVLQHVVNPINTVDHFGEHLTEDGLLFLTTRFQGNYNLALDHNEILGETFPEWVLNLGFKKEKVFHMWGDGESAKYLYVLRKD